MSLNKFDVDYFGTCLSTGCDGTFYVSIGIENKEIVSVAVDFNTIPSDGDLKNLQNNFERFMKKEK